MSSFSTKSVNLFIQLVLEDIVGEILVQQTKLATDISNKHHSQISENDQSILYYIGGYIVRSLRKKYTQFSVKKLSLLNNFTQKTDCLNFVAKYEKWYSTQNRGGLQKPSDSLFLLVRELEAVVRRTATFPLCASSFLINPLKEQLMESFLVKHYCAVLMPDQPCDIVSAVTEDIIHLFLTIRGFAVTRKERNKISKSTDNNTSTSLRQVLKEKVRN